MTDNSSNSSIPASLLRAAVKALQRGSLVAFPTETVYGLGADASNTQALTELYRVKGRPAARPLTVHLADVEDIAQWAADIPPAAQKLIDSYCPGPLTLILPRRPEVLDIVTAGSENVGIRLPSHPLARQLIRAFGKGLAAPSANRSGYLSPTTAEHVRQEFGADVPIIIDGGPCQLGLESTIVDFSTSPPRLLRSGLLTLDMLQETAGVEIQTPALAPAATSGAHYKPHTAVQSCPTSDLQACVERELAQHHLPLAVLYYTPRAVFSNGPDLRLLQLPNQPLEYAQRLYASLRYLDGCSLRSIIIEDVPNTAEWAVLRQRVQQIAPDNHKLT